MSNLLYFINQYIFFILPKKKIGFNMNISDVLRLENISSELKGTTKEEVINELIDLLKNDDRVINLEDVRKAVF
jgi:hypothetical protein